MVMVLVFRVSMVMVLFRVSIINGDGIVLFRVSVYGDGVGVQGQYLW
jgi:hypothetical protein